MCGGTDLIAVHAPRFMDPGLSQVFVLFLRMYQSSPMSLGVRMPDGEWSVYSPSYAHLWYNSKPFPVAPNPYLWQMKLRCIR